MKSLINGYISIPEKGFSLSQKKEIEKKLPKPLVRPGFTFIGYKWIKLSQIKYQDKAGNTFNPVRLDGTRKNESLRESLRKGIDIRELTPSVYPNNNLMNGHHRVYEMKYLGYTEWIFAIYQPDESSFTEFQDSLEDALEDFRFSANNCKGQKPVTVEEVTEGVRRRFEKTPLDKSKMVKYIKSLDLSFSGQQCDAIANKVIKDRSRKGVIEWFDRDKALEYVDGLGVTLLNTNAGAKAQRLLPCIMNNFVENGTTLEIATFDSDACSHDEIDEKQKNTLEELKELEELALKYAAAKLTNPNIKPYNIKGSIPQKIVKDVPMPKGLIPYEE
tara:strand:- start:87 stop:1079 length:993 start_codon:yes stop_codon:yes gene_type:complete